MARELYVNVRKGLIQTTGPSPKRAEEEAISGSRSILETALKYYTQ
jgi:hypothetical protein